MKLQKPASAWLIVGLFLVANAGIAASTPDLDTRTVARKAATARVPFIKNDGQINHQDVSYYAKLSSGTLFVTAGNDLVYSFQATPREGRWAFRESFVERSPSHPVGTNPSAIRVSQFKGGRPEVTTVLLKRRE